MQPRAVFGKRPSAAVEAPAAPPKPFKRAVIEFCEPDTEASVLRLEAETTMAAAGGADEIVWVIASPGGELLPVLEYCHKLSTAPLNLKTAAVGCVASAATFLMLAGKVLRRARRRVQAASAGPRRPDEGVPD